jgi:hypothetical protein
MKIEVDVSHLSKHGDEETPTEPLDGGWQPSRHLGPILALRQRQDFASDSATAPIEFNGETMRAFGWEASLPWGGFPHGERRKYPTDAVDDTRDMVRAVRSGDVAKFVRRR